jgi:predicted oxidoreductase
MVNSSHLNIYSAIIPDRMHHLDLGLFNYQVTYTRELLKEVCGQVAVDELDNRLASIPRFPGLKIFKNGLENIKRFTADEFRNMMKVFIFVIEGIIIKHHKEIISANQAKRIDSELVQVYVLWCKMYLYSRQEYFFESELGDFKVLCLAEYLYRQSSIYQTR